MKTLYKIVNSVKTLYKVLSSMKTLSYDFQLIGESNVQI